MNSKTFSIIVSYLIVSNFFTELLGGNLQRVDVEELGPYYGGGLRPGSGAGLKPYGSGAGLRSKRSNAEPLLDLTLSADAECLIVRNTTSNIVILIDPDREIVLLFDGIATSGVIINQAKNESKFVPDGLWDASEQSLIEYLQAIKKDIPGFLNQPGEDFTLPEVPLNILEAIGLIVKDLVVSLDPEIEQRPEVALELVLSVSTGIETLLKGNIQDILLLVRDQQIQLAVDISGVKNTLQGIATINSYLEETAKDVISRNGNLDISSILGASNGLVALSELLRQLGEIDDLSPLNDPLGDPEMLAKLIAQLGGNSNVGITGVFRVVGEIIALANGRSNLDRVISILIQVVAESSEVVKDDLSNQLTNSLTNFLEILKQNRCTDTLSDLVTIIKDLLRGELIVDEVNISNIISTILTGVVKPKSELLNVIISVLQCLSPIVDLSESIPELLLVIIIQLDSATGIRNLISLGLDLGRPGCACSLLPIALKTIKKLIKELSQDLCTALSKLPIIGNIIEALEDAVQKANLDLKELLSSASETRVLIIGLFQLVSNVDLGIAVAEVEKIGERINLCNGLATLVAVEVTVGIIVINN